MRSVALLVLLAQAHAKELATVQMGFSPSLPRGIGALTHPGVHTSKLSLPRSPRRLLNKAYATKSSALNLVEGEPSEGEAPKRNSIEEAQGKKRNSMEEVEAKRRNSMEEVEAQRRNSMEGVEAKKRNSMEEVQRRNSMEGAEAKKRNSMEDIAGKEQTSTEDGEAKQRTSMEGGEAQKRSSKEDTFFVKRSSMEGLVEKRSSMEGQSALAKEEDEGQGEVEKSSSVEGKGALAKAVGQGASQDIESGLPMAPSQGAEPKRGLFQRAYSEVDYLHPKRKNVPSTEVVKAIFNLIKNIVGAGVLSLPSGISAIGGQRSLVLPAVVLASFMGCLSAYTFFSIGRTCGIQGVSTYNNAWAKSVNQKSACVVSTVAIIYPLACCLSYAIIVGDFFSSLAQGGVLGSWLAKSPIATNRKTWVLAWTLAVFYPLCSFRKLAALAYTSLLGGLAAIYTIVFMMIRMSDGSYLWGGQFHDAVPVPPVMLPGSILKGLRVFFSRIGVFNLLAMCGGAFCPHSNAPSYYDEVGRDPAKFKLLVLVGFAIGVAMNVIFMVGGFLTFGSACNGVILNSYAATDPLAAVGRVMYGITIVFTYPVIFSGLKPVVTTMLLGLKKLKLKDGKLMNQALTVLPIILITIVSLLFDNAGVVTAIRGCICGSTLVYMFPTLMYLLSSYPAGDRFVKEKNKLEKVFNWALLVFSFIQLGLGMYTSLKPYLFPATVATTTTTTVAPPKLILSPSPLPFATRP